MSPLFSITLLFLNLFIQPPVIKGVVVDKDSNTPVSYVSIGVVGKHYGTYSSIDGQFNLELPEFTNSDSIRYSCIGYSSLTFSVDEILQSYKNGLDTIFLTKKVTELEEVIVYSGQYKAKVIGNKLSNKAILLGFLGDMERGIIIENDDKLFLENISFKLAGGGQQPPDSAIFRFNVYSVKNHLPDENILQQPVYFHITQDGFNSTNKFDISKYNITVDDDFAATFELVKQYGSGRIFFTGWLRGYPSVRRRGTQGTWIESRSDNSGTKLHQLLKIEVLYLK